MSSLIGRHIGRYRILEQLGQGGMSIVYKGLDTALDREVAVKVLHAHLAGKEESRRRLAREAKAVAKLHHPNILEVYDFAASDSEQAYIVTEYIRGQTLRQYAETIGFEPPEIAALVVHDIAAALAQAHDASIIHRDLKPENVMVRDDGVIKLMDFGIAKIIDRDDKMTMTGALVGSPAHMAPEIIEGEEAGAEADVFSLGTMLFYFATGRLPFSAPNTTATLKKILDGIYDDPRQLVPTVSDDLAEIIATCLARQPSSRYASAGKLRDALHEYLSGLGLGRTTEELCAFFADPPSYRKALVPRMTQALVARGEKLIAEKRPAKALAALNQVLALEPNNARAVQLLQEMNVARKKQRTHALWKRAAIAGIGVAVVVGTAIPAYAVLTRPPDFVPSADPVAGVVVPASAFPAARAPEPKTVAMVTPPVATTDPAPAKTEEPKADPNPKSPFKDRKPGEGMKVVRVEPSRLDVKPTAALIPVAITFRPFGYIEVDGGPRTEERERVELQLTEGKHTVKYGCSYCEPVTETWTVSATNREFFVGVRALPARLAFDFTPREAQVRVRGELRTAGESISKPFDVRSPRGSTVLKHKVEYEVFLPGYKTATGLLELLPGETKILSGKLTPE